MKRGPVRLLALALVPLLLSAPASAAFSDVAEDAWYAQAASYVQLKGFMTGDGDGRFDPQGTMTRGMLAVVLHRLAGAPHSTAGLEFDDILAGDWFADAVLWCEEVGIATGVDAHHFAPHDPVTREQLALMLWRLAGWPESGPTAIFWDGAQISEWSRLGVDWAVRAGVVTGKDNGCFDPQGYATRAEAAQMLMRYDRWRLAQAG